MSSLATFALLLLGVVSVLSFSPPAGGRPRPYTLPKIGQHPAPQTTFPRNQGLPDAYSNGRHLRSVDETQVVSESKGTLDEVHRETRSLEGEPAFSGAHKEMIREKRDESLPTYRPPVTKGRPIIF